MNIKEAFTTLGLSEESSFLDAKKAYWRLARLTHPDMGGEKGSERFIEARNAYEEFCRWKTKESRPKWCDAEIGKELIVVGVVWNAHRLSRSIRGYVLVDELGRVYHWRTRRRKGLDEGNWITLSGTVKDRTFWIISGRQTMVITLTGC